MSPFRRNLLVSSGVAAIVALALLGSMTSPTSAQDVTTSNGACSGSLPTVERTVGLEFAKVDGQSLKLDLLRPNNAAVPVPGLIFLHSGGFVGGDRTWGARLAAFLASQGFVVAISDYRLSPASPFPAAINDAQSVAAWLRTNAVTYQVDPTRIGVVGGSSGGYLAAVLGTNLWSGTDWSGAPPEARVQAAVAVNPALVLPPVAQSNMELWRPGLEAFLGPFEANPARWQMASPAAHVSELSAPFLFLHGTADPLYSQSVDMVQSLQRIHVRAELFTAVDAPHGVLLNSPWCQQTVPSMQAFLNSVLK
jgi:pectinesterase